MIIFRLISFGIRIVSTFVIVFLLQIQFDGRPLETYLVQAGHRFMGTQVLNHASHDVTQTLRSLTSENKKNEVTRRLSDEVLPVLDDLQKRITWPESEKKKDND